MADIDSMRTNENSLLIPNTTEYESVELNVELKDNIKHKLYVSHFLYVWNARIYEFGIVLFIINLYPKDLLPPSLFALVSTCSAILFTNHLTKFVNKGERLSVIKSTIFVQRFFAILSSLTLLITFEFFKSDVFYKHICLAIVIICGIVERLATIANKMSISRDWIVKICGKDQDFLLELNTKLRSIDLFCKLIGPFFISTFLSLTNHEITAIFFILSFLISNTIEFSAILNIYHIVPILKNNKNDQLIATTKRIDHNSSYWKLLHLFLKNPISLSIISVSMAYFTVLSFGNSTVAYLLSFDDINNFKVGCLKAISTFFELFGTVFVFPFLNKYTGLINTEIISVSFQFLTLLPVAFGFLLNYPYTRWLMCICIPFSRIGLWCFDLSVQNSIQIHIKDDFQRFNATSFEETFNNLFELLGYLSTLVYHKPEQFEIPAVATVVIIGLSTLLNIFWYIRLKIKNIDLDSE